MFPTIVRAFDLWLSRQYGIFPFDESPDCIVHVQVSKATHPLEFPDCAVVETGQPVVLLHLWNEHLPPMPPEGPNLGWSNRTMRLFVDSLRGLARQFRRDPRLEGVRAVGGVTALFSPDGRASGVRWMERLGFMVAPYHRPLGRFGEFWENLYSWWLLEAYNPGSMRHRSLLSLWRAEIWMPVEKFVDLYGE